MDLLIDQLNVLADIMFYIPIGERENGNKLWSISLLLLLDLE